MTELNQTEHRDINALEKNARRVLALSFFQTFMVVIPVVVPFMESKGLDMAAILSLQAIFAAVIVLLEVPSGYLADVLGRKLTLVIGSLFYGIGNSLLVVADGFWGLAAFEICLCLLYTSPSPRDLSTSRMPSSA